MALGGTRGDRGNSVSGKPTVGFYHYSHGYYMEMYVYSYSRLLGAISLKYSLGFVRDVQPIWSRHVLCPYVT